MSGSKLMRRLGQVVLGTAAVASTAFAAPAVVGVTDKEIIVGGTTPLTGPAAIYSDGNKAARAYFDSVNEQGGVFGRKIKYLIEDDAYNAAKTVAATRKLVDKDKIFAIFLPVGYGQLSTADFLSSKKVPQLFVSEGSESFTNKPNIIRGIMRWSADGTELSNYVVKNFPGKKVAILHENAALGTESAEAAKKVLAAGKLQLVANESYESMATNVDGQVANIIAAKPDVVILLTIPNIALSAIKSMHQKNFKPKFVSSFVNVSSEFITNGGADVEGLVSGAFLQLPADETPGMAAHKKLLAKYLPDVHASIVTLVGQADAELLVETLKRAGKDLTREKAIKAAESIKDFTCSVCQYPVSLSDKDHETFETMKLMQVKGGKWTLLEPAKAASAK